METILVLEGLGRALVGEDRITVSPGDIIHLPPGTLHTFEALEDLKVVEVSTPELDDVVRVQDRYGRAADSDQ